MMVLERVGVFSVAKTLGLLYAFFGLLAGAIITLVSVIGSAIGGAFGRAAGMEDAMVGRS